MQSGWDITGNHNYSCSLWVYRKLPLPDRIVEGGDIKKQIKDMVPVLKKL